MNDVVINKVVTIERCVARIREVHGSLSGSLLDAMLEQESIFLNLERACQAAIDLAMHTVHMKRFGVPQSSRDAFDLLEKNHVISPDLSRCLKNMVGFRNIAIHEYQTLKLEIIESIVQENLQQLLDFGQAIRRSTQEES